MLKAAIGTVITGNQKVVTIVNSKLCHLSTMGRFIALNPRHVLRLLKSRYFF